MTGPRFIAVLYLFVCAAAFYACSDSGNSGRKTVFEQLPEIREIKPETPVKIKMRRNASGSYSWELRGDDADRLIETDRKLRRILEEGG